MLMTGLGSGSHQQTVVAVSLPSSDRGPFFLGELFRNQGLWLVVVDGGGGAKVASKLSDGRLMAASFLVLTTGVGSVCGRFPVLKGTGCRFTLEG